MAYLASGGREGALLEEVEGLTSGKHDDVCEEMRWMGKREEKEEVEVEGKEEKRTKGLHFAQFGASAVLPMLGPSELNSTPRGLLCLEGRVFSGMCLDSYYR